MIELLIIGGAAMALAHGDRATLDIDVISDYLPTAYRQAAEDISHTHQIRRDWLNDAGKGFAPTMNSEPHEVVFAGERLVVMTPPATYLLATKLRAAREQDVPDVLRLMRLSGRTSERELLDLLEVAYPSARLTPRMHYFAMHVAATFS